MSSEQKEKLQETTLRETGDEGSTADDGNNGEAKPVSDNSFPNLGDLYEVLGCIGQGGMGFVYKVRDKSIDKIFAVKVLQAKLTEDAAALKRFQQEAESASQLMHSNLVTVYGHGTTPDGAPYIVMDFLDGSGLSDHLKKDHHLEPNRALNIFIQICEALNHAHSNGVIHRDIKPTNVILTRTTSGEERAHIVDFGIAKATPTANRETHDLTQTGEIFGSPHYMSPEQCLGFMLDNRSDIYSLGCLMYEVLSGGTPFEGANPIQVVVKHINEDPPGFPTAMKGDKLLDKLETVVLRCLEKDKTSRYQSVDHVLKDLLAIKAGKQPEKFVRTVKPKATLTQKQTLGVLVTFFAAAMYICVLSGVLSTSSMGQIFGAFLTFLCGSGVYVFYSAARDEYRKNKSAGISERKAWVITLLTLLGTCCLTAMPAALTFLCNISPSSRSDYEAFLSATVFTHFMCASLTAVCLICFFIFRFPGKARATIMAAKFALTAVVIGSLLYFVVPQQTEKVSMILGQLAERNFPEMGKTFYEVSAVLDKKSAEPFRKIANMYRGTDDNDKELDALRKAIERQPSTDLYERCAEIYIKQGNDPAALAEFEKIIAFDPKYSYVYQQRSEFFFKHGEFLKALADLRTAAAINQPNAAALVLSAQANSAVGNFSEAVINLSAALDSAYDDKIRIRMMRAILNEHRGLAQQAMDDYRYIASNADRWNEKLYKAYALYKIGDMKGFKQAMGDAVKDNLTPAEFIKDINLGPLLQFKFPKL